MSITKSLVRRGPICTLLPKLSSRSYSGSPWGQFKLPEILNEPMKNYAPNSPERVELAEVLKRMKSKIHQVPLVVNGEKIFETSISHSEKKARQLIGCDKEYFLCEYTEPDPAVIKKAISGALKAKKTWEKWSLADRCGVFMRAADLLSTKYRYDVMAATMWGQGKTIWQAEIDSVAELADFWRFNCKFAEGIYADQPPRNSPYVWNKVEYRPLDGFVYAISPFNFTAIGGNLASAPALMGNVVIWKPAQSAIYSNYLVYQILEEAGLPPGVIQFIPGPAESISDIAINHPEFAGLHFTGSTEVFKNLYKKIIGNLDVYHGFPRIVGETGGKNMHFIHSSANIQNVVNQTIRGAFEYQGQKCSACSRIYVPASIWPSVKNGLIEGMKSIRVGPVDDFRNFMSAVINKFAYDKCVRYLDQVKNAPSEYELLYGGKHSDSKGYYVYPTLIQSASPTSVLMKEEIFGPILAAYVYPDAEYEKTLKLASETSPYALTGSIFSSNTQATSMALDILSHSAGNIYINDKCTGAVVGQQPFGGSKASGTNDKAGSPINLMRWVSPRAIKELLVGINDYSYPSCQ